MRLSRMSRNTHDPLTTQFDGIIGYVYVGGKQTTLRLSMVLGKALNVTGEGENGENC
jgi:hypothetical protein